jgi:hypothetical protein
MDLAVCLRTVKELNRFGTTNTLHCIQHKIPTVLRTEGKVFPLEIRVCLRCVGR